MNSDIIRNINCELTQNTHNKPIFRLRWEWLIAAEEPAPSLHLLYRVANEEEILDNSLFTQDAITSHMFKGMNEHTHNALIASGRQYGILECTFRSSGSIFYEGDIEIKQTGCVYFFYLVNKNGTIFHSFARKVTNATNATNPTNPTNDTTVAYEELKGGFFNRKNSARKIKIKGSGLGSGRIILQTSVAGQKLYSLLPSGNSEYYLDPKIEDFKLIYVTNLINIQ
ncbi:MAG: hypothetical protein FWG68_10965 [Defluviitaleaceae bacterium]|nr:hypothetical protein [Defluviitaleaceae bacterium]